MEQAKDGEEERDGARAGRAGADFLQLDPAEAPRGGLAGWLAERLRGAIADGRLPTGSRLPATRALAAELGVSRGVVTEAYRRLSEGGQISGRGRNGTVVAAAPAPAPAPAAPAPAPPDGPFSADPGPDVFAELRAAPARYDLTPGVPSLSAFPRAAWLRAERAVLDGLSAADLGYGDPAGTPALRRAVAGWLARNRGIRAAPGDVVIVAGVSQALSMLVPVLAERGIDAVAVEEPGSMGVRRHLAGRGAATPPVPVDRHGIRVAALRATGARAVMLTPAHQFPTGVVLGGERRRELADWARAGGLVIEDDYDAEHRYDRPPVAAFRSLLPDRVCYLGSVSKLLAPALRTGWIVPPPELRGPLAAAKRDDDLGNAVLPQLVLARLMDSGDMERHLRFLRRRHRLRRDAMIAALAAGLPDARVHGAAAGLHLTVTFGGDFDDTALAAAALAEGVKTQPLSWHRRLPGPPGLVLGYAACSPGAIAEAVALLARARRGFPGPPRR
ncbi:MocR-like pyridoxine biosynthesis transcription factor PdxR [Nocardiopsis potens]|uniref:MocR-like pyridoxine biosynthesis transcription factor PdxR n=1 Tax=Nocardiopsis potens TaxID=1246458 RepID=UPI0003498922|nr:PLP-dependent aminotransferase family protein [Nocardiopsis potens]